VGSLSIPPGFATTFMNMAHLQSRDAFACNGNMNSNRVVVFLCFSWAVVDSQILWAGSLIGVDLRTDAIVDNTRQVIS
jgi:hypothetical protein